jgi:hypothetical protein
MARASLKDSLKRSDKTIISETKGAAARTAAATG